MIYRDRLKSKGVQFYRYGAEVAKALSARPGALLVLVLIGYILLAIPYNRDAPLTVKPGEVWHLSTSFSNDMSVAALCSLTVWLLATSIGHPLRLWWAILRALLTGLATLAKLSGLGVPLQIMEARRRLPSLANGWRKFAGFRVSFEPVRMIQHPVARHVLPDHGRAHWACSPWSRDRTGRWICQPSQVVRQ